MPATVAGNTHSWLIALIMTLPFPKNSMPLYSLCSLKNQLLKLARHGQVPLLPGGNQRLATAFSGPAADRAYGSLGSG
jgi:hypothetical protein